MPQHIHDNTEDEFTHQNFINAYLLSKGAEAVTLEPFRTLTGSTATGTSGQLRLTNLMQLTLDTSWWTRYRSSTKNPDLDPPRVIEHRRCDARSLLSPTMALCGVATDRSPNF